MAPRMRTSMIALLYDHKHIARIAGIPHCVAYGPGEIELAHQPDESCKIGDLVNATKVIALATLDLMSREKSAQMFRPSGLPCL